VSVFKSSTFFQALSPPVPLQDILIIKLLKFYNICFYFIGLVVYFGIASDELQEQIDNYPLIRKV